jgi:hypothetical protein
MLLTHWRGFDFVSRIHSLRSRRVRGGAGGVTPRTGAALATAAVIGGTWAGRIKRRVNSQNRASAIRTGAVVNAID